MANFLRFSDEKITQLLQDIFDGIVDAFSLPDALFVATADKLLTGLFTGFGGSLDDFDPTSEQFRLLKELERNLFVFSGAKTFQQVNAMSLEIIGPDGFTRPFNEFRDAAEKIFQTFNDTWLKAEQRTAINQALGARQWIDIQENKDLLPLLRYQTIGDERVRPEHVVLDDIVKPVNDPFWNVYFPPNGWNCRCIVTQHEAGEFPITNTSNVDFTTIPKLFRMNPGKDEVIFDPKDHPYFKVEDRFSILRDSDFGLIGPE